MPPARKQNMKQKQYCDKFNKDFKTTNLKILKELKEYLKKVKKTMYEQNGNINKEREKT